MSRKTKREAKDFPRFITDLPEADIPFKGVRAWISQGDNHQAIFFSIQYFSILDFTKDNASKIVLLDSSRSYGKGTNEKKIARINPSN